MVYVIFSIPVIMLLLGVLMETYPPENINLFVGYRTSKSMENKEMWDLAHKDCGKLWKRIGGLMIILSFILYIMFWIKVINFNENTLVVIILGQLSLLLLSVLIVENKLKKYLGE